MFTPTIEADLNVALRPLGFGPVALSHDAVEVHIAPPEHHVRLDPALARSIRKHYEADYDRIDQVVELVPRERVSPALAAWHAAGCPYWLAFAGLMRRGTIADNANACPVRLL